MSHLGQNELCKREQSQSYVSKQTSYTYLSNNVETFNSATHDGRVTESVLVKDHEDATRDEEQYRALSGRSQSSDYIPRESMKPGSAHSPAVVSASAIYPTVAVRPSHFETYGHPSHSSASSRSHHTAVHSQAYRHLLPSQSLLSGQYNKSPVALDAWQKYPHSPWIMPPYDDLRLRERGQDRIEIQKEEKERQEWQEQDRLEREERERAQREAVQQHFEESLRLALQKQQQKNPGWSSKTSGKVRENCSNISLTSNQLNCLNNERLREREKESLSSENHDKWIAAMQQQRNEQSPTLSHHQNFASSEYRDVRNFKQETSMIAGNVSSSKPSLMPSPLSSSISQIKHETNFSLYGYQPFQHTYITHAQLKAREDSKDSVNVQSGRPAGNSQLKSGILVKNEKDVLISNSGPNHTGSLINQGSKHEVKASQERCSYQPLVGSGGAFKPYEYSNNNNSIAPPAHQNISSSMAMQSQYHLQDQPQNLVIGNCKIIQENVRSKNDSEDKQTFLSTSVTAGFSPYSNPKNSSFGNTTHSLIQQGLVPNPMYIAASHTGNIVNATSPVHSQVSSKTSAHLASPPVSQQQYVHINPNSGITSGVPVSQSNYTFPPGRTRSYSPISSNPVSNSKNPSNDHLLSNRLLMTVQSGSHRSPSPASNSSSGASHQSSPRVSSPFSLSTSVSNTVSSLPLNSNSQPENPMTASVTLVKRKLLSDILPRKRPKSIDDGLLPPQLQPQIQTSDVELGDSQTVTPPNLLSNVLISTKNEQGAETLAANSNTPSSTNIVQKSVPVPLSMPDLLKASPSNDPELNPKVSSYENLNKHKFPDNVSFSSSSAEEMSSLNIQTLDKLPTLTSSSLESSDEMSASSPAVCNSNVTSTISSNHPKLKKAWLQRHSENEDKKNSDEITSSEVKVFPAKTEFDNLVEETCSKSEPFVLLVNSLCDKVLNESTVSDDSFSDISESKTNKLDRLMDDESSSSDLDIDPSKSSKKKTMIKNKKCTPGKSEKNVDSATDEQSSSKKDAKKKASSINLGSKKRGKKMVNKLIVGDSSRKNSPSKDLSSKPLEKPSISQLKKTGEPFLQDGPCCEVAPRLPKCRECRMTPNQRNKKIPNIFCRFYAYRKLRYGKNGAISSAGFSEPSDASDDDLKLWLPPVDSPPPDIEIETSKFLLTYVGDHFCDLVEMEKEAKKLHMEVDETVTWKRVVQGVREMCDVCETTLFNIHWVCHKCGFVVCIDCYKFRKNTEPKEVSSKDHDGYQWLLCSNRHPHEQEKLMLTQIIAGSSLWILSKILHDIRKKWNIPTYCNCGMSDNAQETKNSSNGICKLMSAVTKCFSSDSAREPNSSDSSRGSKRSAKNSVNGLLKQEDGLGGYSSESGGSPLSWLADVALSSSKISDDKDDDKSSYSQDICSDASADSDEDKSENFSTLRELLIRPTGKMGEKHSTNSSNSQKTLTSTLDEVISCVIEQKVRKSDKKSKEKQLLHFTRKYQMSKSRRELPPVRTCYLSESSLLYPEIPHSWLGNGKILLLKDPCHSGNLQLFQEQWKRGQPVIVADVGSKLDSSLWNPESFIKDFGDIKGDFLNCLYGTLLPKQPLKKFWEGFENINKRIKGEDGKSLVLKMLDWPAGDEFSDIMPSRYENFINVLPLPQYTHRDGALNMASRLPQCFVQPDLGPRMYNAYGISSSLGKGSSNLHLDVSDAINVLAYVADHHKGKEEAAVDILKALDETGCDSLMKKRAKDKSSKPGAIWHVFNARDADKIRDFLNKVSQEQGVKLNPHHDPIHNQEWYLDQKLRTRLFKEYGVEAYSIAQFYGDAIFIPAGSPHQVLNLFSCIIISEDFVSPESVGHSFFLTQEIRNLNDNPINHEDKLQIKNIIYHAVKDALALLQSNDPQDLKM